MRDILHDKILYENPNDLSNDELLQITFGNKNIAKEILSNYNSLEEIYNISPYELLKIKGLTKSKIAIFKASQEIIKRVFNERLKRGEKFLCSEDVFKNIAPLLKLEKREVFMILPLDSKNKLIQKPIVISIGSSISTVVNPKEVLFALIKVNAVSAIIVHNHPSSGDPEPSSEDIEISNRLKKLGDLLGIKFLDHIIIGDGNYVSFTDRKLW